MKFSAKDRYAILDLLPIQSNLQDQIICQSIRKSLDLTPDFFSRIKLSQVQGGISASWELEDDMDVELNEIEKTFLKSCVQKNDTENKIHKDNLDICLKLKNL